MSGQALIADRLPPLCYIRHVTTGAVAMIRRGENG